MTIQPIWLLDPDGGFFCADLTSGIACYAYPFSTIAEKAQHTNDAGRAELVEANMRQELSWKPKPTERDSLWIQKILKALQS